MAGKKRYIILDTLRGFAILGIILANYPEFSLWTFGDPTGHSATDRVVQTLLTFFVDGKFYTLFSLLFGMGFAIQLENAEGRLGTFYRRMAVLLALGILHLLFLWSGDILMLYALMGMLLPLFRKLPTKGLLAAAVCFLVLPVLSDALLGTRPSAPLETAYQRVGASYGIEETAFSAWLSGAASYREVFQFLQMGAVERMWEFVSTHRYFKVLGLFLIGYAAGRERIFADLEGRKALLMRILVAGLAVGVPAGFAYTWSAMNGRPLGTVPHSVFYLFGVYPAGLAYAAAFCLLFNRRPEGRIWKLFAAPGRMACTNYLFQSVFGMLLFYGIGLGLGGRLDLLRTELAALGVYAFQVAFSALWLRGFRFGPVEWIWRMLTYGKVLPLRKG